MSCVCILTPVVIAAWPAFSAAVAAAATSLGYEIISTKARETRPAEETAQTPRQVQLEVPHSNIVTDQLARDQHLAVQRDNVTITFSRDPRGQAALCVSGTGYSDETLRQLGEELSQRVVQHHVYNRLVEEIKARQFVIVEEETEANQAIRLKVRLWEQ